MTLPEDFRELVEFAMKHYEATAERAETIVTNHADEVRARMEEANAEKEAAPKEESGATETAKPDSSA